MHVPGLRLCAPPAWRDDACAALVAAGVSVSHEAPLGLALTHHRVVDDELSRWTVDSLPHLLVGVWPHGIEVGPWVVPGRGPCAHCAAAEAPDTDFVDRSRPPVLPLGLLAIVAGWAARDAAAWRSGRTPSTWATGWWLGDGPVPAPRRIGRHPYCGCAWWDAPLALDDA